MDELMLTSASLLDILSNIDELNDKDISVNETDSGIDLSIGDSLYKISSSDAYSISVDQDVVEEISDVADEAYEDLQAEGVDISERVEGGPIKEIVKTLLIGGMIKITANMLK